jgi:hypothetical protein
LELEVVLERFGVFFLALATGVGFLSDFEAVLAGVLDGVFAFPSATHNSYSEQLVKKKQQTVQHHLFIIVIIYRITHLISIPFLALLAFFSVTAGALPTLLGAFFGSGFDLDVDFFAAFLLGFGVDAFGDFGGYKNRKEQKKLFQRKQLITLHT